MSKITNFFRTQTNEDGFGPFLIAEAGVNHEGSMNTAKRLIDEAKQGGADAIKFQTYKASTLASKFSPAYWDTSKEKTKSQYELFSKHDSFWFDEMVELKKHCDDVGIDFMSTPFDFESAEFLNDLMDCFKISSSDLNNKPFIEHICSFEKPIILSTGASSLDEIEETVSWIDAYKNELALLHCVLNYPTPDKNANLGMIKGLRENFPNNIIGYSDHTLPNNMMNLVTATLLGAQIIEKHFTHDKTLIGNDHYHAMDLSDLKNFYNQINQINLTFGIKKVGFDKAEEISRKNARRSLVLSSNLKEGTIIKKDHIQIKRPAHGIEPKYIEEVIGKKLKIDKKEDDFLNWSDLD